MGWVLKGRIPATAPGGGGDGGRDRGSSGDGGDVGGDGGGGGDGGDGRGGGGEGIPGRDNISKDMVMEKPIANTSGVRRELRIPN